MPRLVDPSDRRAEIVSAAIRILSRGGTSALTLRSLADELNGSMTLVTHFVANRADLFGAIVDDLVAGYEDVFADILQSESGDDRLQRLIEWLQPLTPERLEREAGRTRFMRWAINPTSTTSLCP